jgi:hypothetical protein
VLVSYGEPVIDVLAHFMQDPDEDIWVRRHIPGTLAQIVSQKSVDVLTAALGSSRRVPAVQGDRRARTPAPDRTAR